MWLNKQCNPDLMFVDPTDDAPDPWDFTQFWNYPIKAGEEIIVEAQSYYVTLLIASDDAELMAKVRDDPDNCA